MDGSTYRGCGDMHDGPYYREQAERARGRVVTSFHGYAMICLQGSSIKLYDPAEASVLRILPADFRHDFQAVLFRQ